MPEGEEQQQEIENLFDKIMTENFPNLVKETVTYKGVPIRLSADFSKQTLQATRGWKEVSEVMKGKDLHPRLPYRAQVVNTRPMGRIRPSTLFYLAWHLVSTWRQRRGPCP